MIDLHCCPLAKIEQCSDAVLVNNAMSIVYTQASSKQYSSTDLRFRIDILDTDFFIFFASYIEPILDTGLQSFKSSDMLNPI